MLVTPSIAGGKSNGAKDNPERVEYHLPIFQLFISFVPFIQY
jgi:hypothetical protein